MYYNLLTCSRNLHCGCGWNSENNNGI